MSKNQPTTKNYEKTSDANLSYEKIANQNFKKITKKIQVQKNSKIKTKPSKNYETITK